MSTILRNFRKSFQYVLHVSHLIVSYTTIRGSLFAGLYASSLVTYVHRHHFVSLFVTGSSMSPTLSPDFNTVGTKDYVLFRKDLRLADEREEDGYRTIKKSEIERGMIVLFRSPHDPSRFNVKRIVALEGDVVIPKKGARVAMSRDDERAEHPEAITVPFGHVWVEGDNKDKSVDSNFYGPLSKSLIMGVATRFIWPSSASRRGQVNWRDGWEEKCEGRIQWKYEEGRVPEDWEMY